MANKTEFIRNSLTTALSGRGMAMEGDGTRTAISDTDRPTATKLGSVVSAGKVRPMRLPYFDVRVTAGFPIPLDNDEKSQDIELLSLLCPHPEASYLIRIIGDSMIDAGVESGDIVIVDKSRRNPGPKEIAVCELNGEYTLKHFVEEDGQGWLVPDNPDYPRFRISPEDDFSVWGTVTYIIHKPRG